MNGRVRLANSVTEKIHTHNLEMAIDYGPKCISYNIGRCINYKFWYEACEPPITVSKQKFLPNYSQNALRRLKFENLKPTTFSANSRRSSRLSEQPFWTVRTTEVKQTPAVSQRSASEIISFPVPCWRKWKYMKNKMCTWPQDETPSSKYSRNMIHKIKFGRLTSSSRSGFSLISLAMFLKSLLQR